MPTTDRARWPRLPRRPSSGSSTRSSPRLSGRRASDIHIEPYEKTLRVRLPHRRRALRGHAPATAGARTAPSPPREGDGAARHRRAPPAAGRPHAAAAHRRRGDRRARLRAAHDLRRERSCCACSTARSSSATGRARLRDHEALALLRDALADPYGLVLVTGPTGSGKTTTLYAALAELNTRGTQHLHGGGPGRVATLHGVNQVQARDDIGLTFATALRAFLRQDPDVIMVGEIRDLDTADIAVKAALTGHLVLSTLHTNDAAVSGHPAPRHGHRAVSGGWLARARRGSAPGARRLCSMQPRCTVQADVLRAAGWRGGPFSPRRGGGCRECAGAGYRGRTAVYELMPIGDVLRERIVAGASALELGRLARCRRDAHASSERSGARRWRRHVPRGGAARHAGGCRRNLLSAAVSHRLRETERALGVASIGGDVPAWHDPCSCLDRCAASNRSSRRPSHATPPICI